MIRILTDSTADITPDLARQWQVEVVPLQVNFGEETFQDGIDLTSEEFYQRLESCDKLPTTSQPSPEAFASRFSQAAEAGDEVVAVLLSSHLSGTLQAATIAAEDYPGIHIVDSGSVTLGLQLLVKLAVQLRDSGLSADEIVARLEEVRGRLRIFAVADDLKYLRKGGRLSGASAFAGTLLGIKPVIQVADGKVGLAGKARGMPGAYVALFKLLDSCGGIDITRDFMVGYTGSHKACEPILRYLVHNLGLPRCETGHIGTVVGTHAGPGAAGIAFFCSEETEEEQE